MTYDLAILPCPPWRILADAAGEACVRRLRQEVTPGHVLHGVEARALARYDDDVLYALEGGFAVVHLTYGTTPQEPPWPHTEIYDGWEEFLAAWQPGEADEGGA